MYILFFGVIVLMCILWFACLLYYWAPHDFLLSIRVDKKIFFSDVVDIMETGDILLFTGSNFTQRSLRATIRSYFDHCSMVVKEGKRINLWESDIGQRHKKGSRIIPLCDKLERYKGYKFFVYIPYIGKDINTKKLIKSMIKNKDQSIHTKRGLVKYFVSYDVLSPIISCVPFFNDGAFCSELVCDTLMDVDVMKKDMASKFAPHSFFNINNHTIETAAFGDMSVVYF